MARFPSQQKTHRPKDFCTIEQAEQIANTVADYHVRRLVHIQRQGRWHRRAWRAIRKMFARKAA